MTQVGIFPDTLVKCIWVAVDWFDDTKVNFNQKQSRVPKHLSIWLTGTFCRLPNLTFKKWSIYNPVGVVSLHHFRDMNLPWSIMTGNEKSKPVVPCLIRLTGGIEHGAVTVNTRLDAGKINKSLPSGLGGKWGGCGEGSFGARGGGIREGGWRSVGGTKGNGGLNEIREVCNPFPMSSCVQLSVLMPLKQAQRSPPPSRRQMAPTHSSSSVSARKCKLLVESSSSGTSVVVLEPAK